MIGKTISHYKILEKIGGGGMGIVYKAQDLKLDRYVALKFLPPHLSTSEEDKQRFIHEAKAASALQHNNICAIHEIDETEDGQLFICLDYYEGETLDKKINDNPLPIEETIDIAIQIAQGLAIAHENEIVHRDIKPANIILTKECVVKVLDFGLAKLSTQTKLTKESTTLGTVSYMSPEQAKGEEVDYRTDIWSLGVIIYEMLTGQLPFKGEYESAVIYSIMNDTQEPVTGLRTGVPMKLERIINKCLLKDPGERYQHVDEMIVDLKGLKNESSGIPTEETKKKRLKSVLLPISIALVIILIVVGYLFIPPVEDGSGWENSIAVIPFTDLSPNKDQEFFCYGVTEQLLTNLSQNKKLKVIARTSVMKYKNTEKSVVQIGKELNVANVLEGSASKIGDRVRIHAQLIRTEDESHVWSNHYDYAYDIDSVFAIYDDISEKITNNLLATLSSQEMKLIKTNRPSNTEAYEYYMRGKYFHIDKFFVSRNIEDFITSEKMFKQAIKLDTNYADSYASLADLYTSRYNLLPDSSKEKRRYMQLQQTYLDTAYRLDPNSAEVNFAKAWMHDSKHEYEEAYKSSKIAIMNDPNNDEYYFGLGAFLLFRGCNFQAIKCLNKAIELNPLKPEYYGYLGTAYRDLGFLDKAEYNYKKSNELLPSDKLEHQLGIWFFLVERERYIEAEELLKTFKTKYPSEDFSAIDAIQYAFNGDKDKALKIYNSSSEDFPHKKFLFTLLKMKDELFDFLYEHFEPTDRVSYLYLKNSQLFDFFRSDPRFKEFLAKHKKLYEENLEKYGDIDI